MNSLNALNATSLFAITLSGCGFEHGIIPSVDAMTDAATGGAPDLLRPSEGETLPPTRAFLLWRPGQAPAGRTVSAYGLCVTNGPASDIDEASECPNPVTAARTYHVADALEAGAVYLWKIRAQYDDGSFSEWSSARSFLTDNSVVSRWLLNGDVTDASGLGHDGTLQGGAAFAPGLVGQALALDGTNDSMTAADTSDHDFGTGDFWLSAWVHPLRDGMAEALITKRDSGNGYELYRSDAGQLVFFSPTCGNAAMGGALPMATWSHVTARRTGTAIRIYVDSALAGMGTCAENFANAGPLTLGTNGPLAGNMEAFQGRIDEVVLRNTGSEEAAIVNEFCADQTVAGVDPLPAACQ